MVSGCSRDFVGPDMTQAINVAGLCEDGIFPTAGGLMDQSSWFIELWQQLCSDQNRIEADQRERRNARRAN